MNKEEYVKFKTAQRLKEKGFDWEVRSLYGKDGDMGFSSWSNNYNTHDDLYSAPTQQMAIRWFWEEKGLNINAIYGDYPALKKSFWMPQIESLDGCYGVDYEDFFREYDSREECIEAALEYALRNLI